MATLSDDVCDALEHNLGRLVEQYGWQTFVSAPLLSATPELPEPWSADLEGVATIMRRLLAWSGEKSPRVHVTDYVELANRESQLASDVTFVGTSADGTIELDVHALCDGQGLVGVLCHQAAGAWLALHKQPEGGPFRSQPLGVEAEDEESMARASEAAIYLGFGVPATNAADSARHSGGLDGVMVVTQWAVTSAGGVSAQAMAYMLAVQLVVRGRDEELREVRKGLNANQRADLDGWLKVLTPQQRELREAFGIPDPEGWPAVEALSSEALPDCEVVTVEAIDRDEERFFNRGRNVFRVRHTKATSKTALGVVIGFAASLIVLAAGFKEGFVFVLILIGAIAGRIYGRSQLYWECSDVGCGALVGEDDKNCSKCGGTLAGEIERAADRLAAEEALEEEALEEEG